MTHWFKSNRFHLLFIIAFLLCAFFYDYFKIMDDPVNGIHIWRQTDGLSIALKYFTEGNPVLEPEMHNRLGGGEGKAVGEFPLMYYVVSLLYQVFGFHFWVYRLTWIFFMFLGFFFLFKFCAKFLDDQVWGLLISIFAFTSPIVIIYGASFIIDPIALALIYIGWYFIYCYLHTRSRKYIFIAVGLVSLAAVFKITSLISIIAFLIVSFVVLTIRMYRGEISTKEALFKLSPFFILTIITITWYSYAAYYNEVHSTSYYFLKAAPIWELSPQKINEVALSLRGWSREFLYDSSRHSIYALMGLIILPIFNKNFKRTHYWLFLLSVVGALFFSVLFYSQFQYHDYYAVNLMFLIPFTVVFFVKKFHFLLLKSRYINAGIKTAFLVLVVLSIIHGSKKAKDRFSHQSEILIEELNEFKNILPTHGITKNDLVLVPHDDSPNITLSHLDMNGWTRYNLIQYKKFFHEKIEQGAKWMIIADPHFYNDPIVESYKDKLVIDYKGVRIYNVQKEN